MENEQSFAARGVLTLKFPCLAALLFVQEKKEEDHQQGDAGHSHISRQESSTANNRIGSAGRLTEARRKVCHQQQQGQSLEKLFECKLCGKTAWPKSNLIKHILVRHQSELRERDSIDIEEYIAVKHSAANVRKSISREYLNSEQKQILVEEFGKNKHPTIQRVNVLVVKTGIPAKRIQIWFKNQRYKVIQQNREKIQPILQQHKHQGMHFGHEVEVGQKSSSKYVIDAAEHFAEDVKALSQQSYPLGLLLLPTNNEEDGMNLGGEDLANSNSNVKITAAASVQNLAFKHEHATEGEDYRLKWELKTESLSTPTETPSTQVDTDIYLLEYNNNKNDHAGSSRGVFSSSSPILGSSSSSCPSPPPHPTAAKLTQEFCRFFDRFVGSINCGEFSMDVIIGMFTRIPTYKRELAILKPTGQDMEEIKQNLQKIAMEMLQRAKKATNE